MQRGVISCLSEYDQVLNSQLERHEGYAGVMLAADLSPQIGCLNLQIQKRATNTGDDILEVSCLFPAAR